MAQLLDTTVTGELYVNRNITSKPSLRWNKSGTYWGGLGYNGTRGENYFGPVNSSGEWVDDGNDTWNFRGTLKQNGTAVSLSGHDHDSTYLKLSGGTTSVGFNSTNLPQFSGSPPYYCGIEDFASGGTLKWQSASSCSVGYATSAGSCTTATKADYPTGFYNRNASPSWMNQSINDGYSTYITSWETTDGASIGFTSNNAGQLACMIDGYFYQRRDYTSAGSRVADLDDLAGYSKTGHTHSYLSSHRTYYMHDMIYKATNFVLDTNSDRACMELRIAIPSYGSSTTSSINTWYARARSRTNGAIWPCSGSLITAGWKQYKASGWTSGAVVPILYCQFLDSSYSTSARLRIFYMRPEYAAPTDSPAVVWSQIVYMSNTTACGEDVRAFQST